jgi:HEAT repeat protein
VEELVAIGTPAVPALIQALCSPNDEVNRNAAHALCRVVPSPIEELIGLLSDNDVGNRRSAAAILNRITQIPSDFSNQLTHALDDPDKYVREWAGQALARSIGANALSSLMENLPGTESAIRMIGTDAIPVLLERFRDSDPARSSAARSLVVGMIRHSPEAACPALARCLSIPNIVVRQATEELLVAFQVEAIAAIPVLTEFLKCSEPDVRESASSVLKMSRSGVKFAIPVLNQILMENPDSGLREFAANALRAFGASPASVPALIASANMGDRQSTLAALRALGSAGHDGNDVLMFLCDRILNGDADMKAVAAEAFSNLFDHSRRHDDLTIEPKWSLEVTKNRKDAIAWMISVLASLGPKAEGAVPRLVAWLSDPSLADLGGLIAWAVGNIGPAAIGAILPLVERLKMCKNDALGLQTNEICNALANIGQLSVLPLLELLDDRDPRLRGLAAETIGLARRKGFLPVRFNTGHSYSWSFGDLNDFAFGSTLGLWHLWCLDANYVAQVYADPSNYDAQGGFAARAIGRLLADSKAEVRAAAAKALAMLDKDAISEVGILEDAHADHDAYVRYCITTALSQVARHALVRPCVLIRLLHDPESNVRRAATVALIHLRNRSDSVISALQNNLQDRETTVRLLSATALWGLTRQSEKAVPVILESLSAKTLIPDVALAMSEASPHAKEVALALDQIRKDADFRGFMDWMVRTAVANSVSS